ncbi:curli production assembly/transport component CsgF [Pontibacter ummariensis]|uniref:Curli production assembly/transport component CsgF n=1 Tax=Pontibacter ummariensis TaxID=1610492 RepID=A0A239D7Z1_9BACT|nr:curli production assembly/transport component CsgF [Pontibacter ummariensis]PRY14293.1 curli production assembly/transport component CsgF [Pontibacter ummariensis]SNS28399.1 curli production assembly/transport component CsgF [Pontibacter ummariensis]
MKKLLYSLTLFLFASFAANSVQAQDIVYTPKNPAFGGNPYNYSWMLSSAQAQDKLKDPNEQTSSLLNRDPLTDFKENLNRQILNQLSRQLVTAQFGEDGLEPGSYTIGNYQIDVTEGGAGINIVIVDTGTGNQTTVTIPYY